MPSTPARVWLVVATCAFAACRPASPSHEQGDAPSLGAGLATVTLPTYHPPTAHNDGWEVARADSEGFSLDKLGAMERAIRAGDFPNLTSVVVARRGKLIYEGYFGESDGASLRDTRSVTKTVAGILLGIAIDKGLVRGVDVPVTTFFADKRPFANPDPRKEAITLEDFLTMSSSLDCNDWEDDSRGNEERMYVEKDWVKFALDLPVRSAKAEKELEKSLAARLEPKDAGRPSDAGSASDASRTSESKDKSSREGTGKPSVGAGGRGDTRDGGVVGTGRRFSYCTAGVGVLGNAIERAAKTPLADFAKTMLWDPLGIEKATWRASPAGPVFAGGGLGLRSRDLLKLAQLYLDGGRWKGKRVVAETWVQRSVSPYARIDDKTEYGYLWWLRSFATGGRPLPTWYMSGNGGNKVAVVPDLGVAVVLTSTNYNAKGMHVVTDRLLQDFVLAAVVN